MPRKSKPSPKQDQTEVRIVLNERGTSGLREQSGFVAEAYNQQITYPSAYPIYNRIRRSTPEIVMIRQAFTAWARQVSPIVDLPEDPSDDDKAYQEFLYSDFENMEGGFTKYIETLVNHTPFMGFGWWEVLPSYRDLLWTPPPFVNYQGEVAKDEWRSEYDDGYIGIRRMAWRDIGTFSGWKLNAAKRVIGYTQQDYPNPPVTLPIEQSLHHTYGDPNNPEGIPGLEPIWRLERLKYNYEQILGIGSEHAAGHFLAKKIEKGDLTSGDKTEVNRAARALLTAQEGNYGLLPYGIDGKVEDIGFQAAPHILDTMKYYSIMMLSVFMAQFIALNTFTNTGALASQVDSSNMGVFSFNGMLDGFASQFDQQIGKRIFAWNKDSFPGLTIRPTIRFSHIENNIDLGALGTFFNQMWQTIPMGEDDIREIRKRSGWMPETLPDPEDAMNKKQPAPAMTDANNNQPGQNQSDVPSDQPQDQQDKISQDASQTKDIMNQALRFYSRSSMRNRK